MRVCVRALLQDTSYKEKSSVFLFEPIRSSWYGSLLIAALKWIVQEKKEKIHLAAGGQIGKLDTAKEQLLEGKPYQFKLILPLIPSHTFGCPIR